MFKKKKQPTSFKLDFEVEIKFKLFEKIKLKNLRINTCFFFDFFVNTLFDKVYFLVKTFGLS